jgi:hypothetical protein
VQSDIESALIGISHLAERLGRPGVNCPPCRSAAADSSGCPMCATGSPGMKLRRRAKRLLNSAR